MSPRPRRARKSAGAEAAAAPVADSGAVAAAYEVVEPILNAPFEEPALHWYLREGAPPEKRDGRRPAFVFPPRDQTEEWSTADGTLARSPDHPRAYELALVNEVRKRVKDWRAQGYPGVTRTTAELLDWWRRPDREARLFFAQLEAAETVIFLVEARVDLRQGIAVPRDEPSDDRKAQGFAGFLRYACKMATGAGKTTVMAMLAAWSILNKVASRGDPRFSDAVLVVCPNVTIRDRLQELYPARGDASIYRTRDLVPPRLLPLLARGRVLVTNWHVFEPQSSGDRVVRTGVRVKTTEWITIGEKTTTARGRRYLTLEDYRRQKASGLLVEKAVETGPDGEPRRAQVEVTRHVESDAALLRRVLGRDLGTKGHVLVMNDEAHHAYRIRRPAPADETEAAREEADLGEDADEYFREATVWVEGLDRVEKQRGINFCVDLSATPFFLGRVGRETNRPFPWTVSDFGLTDAIESGLVKIPQLVVRDTTGSEVPDYYNLWEFVQRKLAPGERGGRKGNPRPEAVLKYADTAIRMLAALWDEERVKWLAERQGDPRPPVFIIVCKTTQLARAVYEWLAEGEPPQAMTPAKIESLRNRPEGASANTIRVDSKVVHETDSEHAKGDEARWMRFTLDTVGKGEWPEDSQGRSIYPEGFFDLAAKLGRQLSLGAPPGMDVRCIVSVGMLSVGWDCNTVTHVLGLRPFMSQLLCEQVVGRALRRTSYEPGEDGKLPEEVAKVFGVPCEVIPFKAARQGTRAPAPKRYYVHAEPAKAAFAIEFPRVRWYRRAIRNRVAVDWATVPPVPIEPGRIPTEVEMKEWSPSDQGRPSLMGPGRLEGVSLDAYRARVRLQELAFELAGALAKGYLEQPTCAVPRHVLFPQLVRIVDRYVREKVEAKPGADEKDLFLAPYFGWAVERLVDAIGPDTSEGEAPELPDLDSDRPGSTAEVAFWTSRDVREIRKSHVNLMVADTKRWEQSAAFYLDRSPRVQAFVKNAGLGFAIPYDHDGRPHRYEPDFIVRLDTAPPVHLVLEVKGYDPLADVKRRAGVRWVDAVNADGRFGRWAYALVRSVEAVDGAVAAAAAR